MLRVFTGLLAVTALTGTTCIGTAGCSQQDVARAFGYTEPALEVMAHTGLFGGGVKFRASSEFSGMADATIDPETGKVTGFKATVNSGVTDVYDAQGRRITENFLAGRNIEWAGMIRQQELVNEGLRDFWAVASKAIDTLGPGMVSNVVSSGLASGLDIGVISQLLDALMQAQAVLPKTTTPTP